MCWFLKAINNFYHSSKITILTETGHIFELKMFGIKEGKKWKRSNFYPSIRYNVNKNDDDIDTHSSKRKNSRGVKNDPKTWTEVKKDYFSQSAGSINVLLCFISVRYWFLGPLVFVYFKECMNSHINHVYFIERTLNPPNPRTYTQHCTHYALHTTHILNENKKALNHFKNAWNKYRAGISSLSFFMFDYWLLNMFRY